MVIMGQPSHLLGSGRVTGSGSGKVVGEERIGKARLRVEVFLSRHHSVHGLLRGKSHFSGRDEARSLQPRLFSMAHQLPQRAPFEDHSPHPWESSALSMLDEVALSSWV